MTGKLDEISVSIGEQRSDLRALNQTFTQHCCDDDRRHNENLTALRAINDNIAKLNEQIRPLAASVERMQPIVDDSQASRMKMAGALSLASAILVGLGWLVTSFAGELVKWVIGKTGAH